MAIITIKNLHKAYGDKTILRSINATVEEGDVIALLGPSGTGKSTLLRGLNMLDRPTSGEVIFEGQDITQASESELDKIRQDMGMVFQSFNLFPNMSVIENVKIALVKVKGVADAEATQTAEKFLTKVGLADKATAYPASLSGGQQQRVAIARAMMQSPTVVLADEPIASLDPKTTKMVMDDLQHLNRDLGMTVVVNLHSVPLAMAYATRIVGLRAGKLVYDKPIAEVNEHDFDGIYAEAGDKE